MLSKELGNISYKLVSAYPAYSPPFYNTIKTNRNLVLN